MGDQRQTALDTRGERTRRAILRVARERFAARGFEDTTLSDVAADAGVSGPTVAFHFGSKDGLLGAVIADYYDHLEGRLDAAIDAPLTPIARLTAFARFWISEVDGDIELFGVFASRGWMRETESETGVLLRERNAAITRRLDRIVNDLKADGTLRADVTTRLLRDAFFGTAEHVLRAQLHTSRRLDHRRAADDLVDLILRGASASITTTPSDAERLRTIEEKLDRILERGR